MVSNLWYRMLLSRVFYFATGSSWFFPCFHLLFRVIGYFRQEFFIVFKFWLVGVVLSIIVSIVHSIFVFAYFKCLFGIDEELPMLYNW